MKTKRYNIPVIVYFVIAASLIAYFFPREGKFLYQFYEGKPWQYGLLTAPNDFPIYKIDDEIKAEKDSVLRRFEPYYRLDQTIEASQVERLRTDYNTTLNQKATPAYMQYIERSLVKLYENGIISPLDLEELKRDHKEKVNLLENNISQSRYISEFFTVKTAYEFIINNRPTNLDRAILQACDINNYLTENITYDKETSDKVREDLIRNISLSSGLVQAGERIVDRGEIVDTHTYNVLRSLKTIHETKTGGNQRQYIIMAGQFILIYSLIMCYWLYLWSFRPKIFHNKRSATFVILCVFMSCILAELCIKHSLFNIYILPLAIVPIVVRTFFDSRTSLFTHMIIVLICALMVPYPLEFILLQTVAGMVVTFSLKDLSQRSQLIRCAIFIFLSYSVLYTALILYQEADFKKINLFMYLFFGINFILLLFTYVLVYILERAFGFVSGITLVELSNTNTSILKKLSETSPGTFQHSLQVSILASEAAAKIGANSQLVRTGALYHDIGKMSNPVFFTENQKNFNPHSQLEYDQSAQIIINHVTEGLKIAEKEKLPKAVTDFIRTHHGYGKAKYFYNSYKNKFPDKKIDETSFTYPGPNPFSKETAILMMADAVEAASRSLTEHTEESIRGLINKIIDGQIADGLLKNAPLTFRDVETIKRVFEEKLKTMYHTRISYPDLKK
ncbi:MAG: HDIG domain-containing protein [Tannerellaceae bacterium]|nr:HDIG domain-containing protein [Tannerellaceae bacterium]